MSYTSWSVTYGEQPSAAKWNILGSNDAHFYSFLGDNLAWQSWTPSLTNVSGGTVNYSTYTQVGKTVHFKFKYTLAGAGVSGLIGISLPVTAAAGTTGDVAQSINALALDSGNNTYILRVVMGSTSRIDLNAMNAAGTYLASSYNTSSTVPFTWGSPDTFSVAGTYEAA